MMTGAECMLCEMLSCGSMDLEMLDKVGYDWSEVLEQADWPQKGLGFNDIMRAVVGLGIIQIREAVDDRISELEGYESGDALGDGEEEELEVLRKLDPDDDIRSFHNRLDTHVWFEENSDIYRQYLSEALDEFANNTGLEIQ